ncbi:protocatechuate 3,4-dioxygenase, alpha subunit [Catenulispora acidiphila DSM 44928]|uniref:Protocatechuate 3,4-dioxygenase, alpha subunit n=1 Tax=Catenulispora acidiphila (strain DSM 44928 / JCM 14897 / NBRC 102108 / NRRL B-24433 / ID139908) TaxID=479433 RepID=C7Q1M0_CATAD|nr:protocatechuate 3,4-dioxygenase subunit alpha [Catenulispora acidiphila]ACU73749.1 protocatechuate 3,4-dioxygenase, alpha subunit [Catenulispora acidiphila DSM 44928]
MHPTPSQTVGPFYGYALPFPQGGQIAPAGHDGALTVHGHVRDGAGEPVPDALLEIWQPAPDGSRAGAPGSLRRDGLTFTGFGRVSTGPDGRYVLRTLPPGGVPYLSVCVFARGLLHHLFTRVYLPDADLDSDALLAALESDRRSTLIAEPTAEHVYRFDIHLQGEKETVFLDFR